MKVVLKERSASYRSDRGRSLSREAGNRHRRVRVEDGRLTRQAGQFPTTKILS